LYKLIPAAKPVRSPVVCGCGFKSHPIQNVNGFKAMPGLIAVPDPG